MKMEFQDIWSEVDTWM